MEGTPLNDAYEYARAAVDESKRANPVAASENHELAAESFAAAAATTKDQEALRVLRLLEAHHKKLGQILKDGPSKPAHVTATGSGTTTSSSTTASTSQPPRLARTAISGGRDLSSSIASNLASARGIPGTRQKRTTPVSPLVSNQHADATFSHDVPDEKRTTANTTHTSTSRPTWAPPNIVPSKASTTVTATAASSPFSQFYNRFQNAISDLTAPLAFTSLPLSQPTTAIPEKDEVARPAPADPTRTITKVEPLDYSAMVSKAALAAVREQDHTRAPHESFLLVPTSGGTMSYADITAANYIDRQFSRVQHQHSRELSHGSNDDFVDASSQILAPPVLSLIDSGLHSGQEATGTNAADRMLRRNHVPTHNGKTMEELTLENAVLRRTLNQTAKRVQGWESLAQQQTSALAQSIRSLTLSPVATPENSRGRPVSGTGGPDLQQKVQELEEMVKKYDRKLGKRDEDNAKLKETLGKYREKWEGLKAGAKARREAGAAAATAANPSGTDKERSRRSSKDAPSRNSTATDSSAKDKDRNQGTGEGPI